MKAIHEVVEQLKLAQGYLSETQYSDDAVDQSLSSYNSGVVAALKWVLGLSDTNPHREKLESHKKTVST